MLHSKGYTAALSAAVSAGSLSLFIHALQKGPNSHLLVFGGGIIAVMNINCPDRCAGEADGSPITAANESRQMERTTGYHPTFYRPQTVRVL